MKKKTRVGCLTLAAMLCISSVSISAAEVNENAAKMYESPAQESAGMDEAGELLLNEPKGAKAAEGTVTIEDVTLTPSGSGYMVTEYTGNATKIDFTAGAFAGYTIVGIGGEVFRSKRNLTEVVLQDTVETIGTKAFCECSALRTCKLPANLVTIGSLAFESTGLTEITIPKSCMVISGRGSYVSGVFGNCKSLTTVTFEERTGDAELVIGDYAFENCTKLRELHFPEQVYSIPAGLCNGATDLKKVTVSDKCTSIGDAAFSGCTSLKEINIPESCETIGKSAFSNTAVTDITVPAVCTSIGKKAFQSCAGLKSVAFAEDESEAGTLAIGDEAFSGCKVLSSIVLPDRVNAIADNTFYQCTQLVSVQISDTCESIGEFAFYGCSSLKEITIPKACIVVGKQAFRNANNLTQVTFLNPDTMISDGAFQGNNKITILGEAGGSVETYARENNFSYQRPIKELVITNNPNKTLYYHGESLLLDGITISAVTESETGEETVAVHGADCTVSGFDSSRVGKQEVKLSYGGAEATFEVTVAYDMTKTRATAENLVYTGEVLTNTFDVKGYETDTALVEGQDYYVEYVGDQTSAGEKTAKLVGKGNYSGEIKVTYRVEPKSFYNMLDLTVTIEDVEYTGRECTPEVILTDGTTVIDPSNYTVEYSSNTAVGTAYVDITGKNNYTGVIEKNFKVLPKSLETAVVTLDNTVYAYNGSAIRPVASVVLDGKVLTAYADYDVTYSNNTSAGRATVAISGKNNYTGVVETTFEIIQKSIETATVTFDKTAYAYTGAAIYPAVSVTQEGKTLLANSDYSVSYVNNINAGTATVTITGKGFYTGSISKTFQISVDIGTITSVGVNSYLVTGMDTVMFRGVSGAATKVTIPESVSIGGKVFKVTAIADKALKGSKVKKVTIGKNVIQIGKQAFMKASKLKTITIKSTKLKIVGKQAFKGISNKAKIKVPKKKYAAYKKLLKGKGQSSSIKIVK